MPHPQPAIGSLKVATLTESYGTLLDGRCESGTVPLESNWAKSSLSLGADLNADHIKDNQKRLSRAFAAEDAAGD